jgi:chromosome segregation protein
LKEQAARLSQEQYAQQLTEAQADEATLGRKAATARSSLHLQGEVTRLTNAIAALGAVNLAALR